MSESDLLSFIWWGTRAMSRDLLITHHCHPNARFWVGGTGTELKVHDPLNSRTNKTIRLTAGVDTVTSTNPSVATVPYEYRFQQSRLFLAPKLNQHASEGQNGGQ